MDGVVLIAVNGNDIASVNQAKCLLEKGIWVALDDVEGFKAYRYEQVRMWYLPERILWEDHLEKRWAAATNETVLEGLQRAAGAELNGHRCRSGP